MSISSADTYVRRAKSGTDPKQKLDDLIRAVDELISGVKEVAEEARKARRDSRR